jgi:plastocyanin
LRHLLPALFLAALPACAPEVEVPVPDRELRAALGLDDQRVIHRITLGGRGAVEHVIPPELSIEEGDVVQFVTVDRRVHVIRFEGEALSGPSLDFLESSGQRTSPPLIHSGSRFVVSFENAPPGSYPFVSTAHGDPAPGVILVSPRGVAPPAASAAPR